MPEIKVLQTILKFGAKMQYLSPIKAVLRVETNNINDFILSANI